MKQVFQGTSTYRVRRQDIQLTGDRATLPVSAGACSSSFTRAKDGLMLARTHYQPVRPLIEETHQPATEKPLHPQDAQRLEQAVEWMKAHLAEPFSLHTLAMAVGLSDYKLKQSFQRRFNTTPGQLLLQLRMEQAHQLLEAGYQVAQAGWQVGYRHANNFSMAFYRYFGYHARHAGGRRAD